MHHPYIYPDTDSHLRAYNQVAEQGVLFLDGDDKTILKADVYCFLYGGTPRRVTSDVVASPASPGVTYTRD